MVLSFYQEEATKIYKHIIHYMALTLWNLQSLEYVTADNQINSSKSLLPVLLDVYTGLFLTLWNIFKNS
jgi:hypothetical protein